MIIRKTIIVLAACGLASCGWLSDKEDKPIELSVVAEQNGDFIQFVVPEQIRSAQSSYKIDGVESQIHVESLLNIASMPMFDQSLPLLVEVEGSMFNISFIFEEQVTLAKPEAPIVYLNGCSYIGGDL